MSEKVDTRVLDVVRRFPGLFVGEVALRSRTGKTRARSVLTALAVEDLVVDRDGRWFPRPPKAEVRQP